MPGEALLIGIATIAVVVAGFAAIAPGLGSDRAGWTAGQRFRLRGIVSTSFNVTFESLLPAVIFPALNDAHTTIVVSSAIVFVYALFVISVRSRQLIQAGTPWVRWTQFVVVSGITATTLFGLNALVFASLTVYALALCIQLVVAAISFYSLAASAECHRIRRFDHVGITVADLDTATAFFVGLGFEIEGRMVMEGEFVDTVIGIPDSRSEIVMLRPPDGGTGLELSSFIRPDHEPGSPDRDVHRTGVAQRHVRGGRPRRDPRAAGRGRLRPGRRHRSVRAHLAHGVCARTRRDHRGPGPAHRLIRDHGRNQKGPPDPGGPPVVGMATRRIAAA